MKKFAIVDIETTGGVYHASKIIEIAIVVCDGIIILDQYTSLVDPECLIPQHITALTGIRNEMVKAAPKFHEIAKTIVEKTHDCVFVAHNVFFDFNFIKQAFLELGYLYKKDKMCTVRLARKYMPGHDSYSLGKLCEKLNIKIEQRHRAMGDAKATFVLLSLIYPKIQNILAECIVSKDKLLLPAQLNESDIEKLPNKPGVYYFYGKNHECLYVGKSNCLQKRVKSHFRPKIKLKKDLKIKNEVHAITYKITGSDLCAQLIECHEIKALRPKFNRALNRVHFRYAITLVDDEQGFLQPKLISCTKQKKNLESISCNSQKVGKQKIQSIYAQAFGLSSESVGFVLHLKNFKHALGKASYNKRLRDTFKKYFYPHANFYIHQPGRHENEMARLVIQNNKLKHIVYIQDSFTNEVFELNEDIDMKNIVLSYIRTHATSVKVKQQHEHE